MVFKLAVLVSVDIVNFACSYNNYGVRKKILIFDDVSSNVIIKV